MCAVKLFPKPWKGKSCFSNKALVEAHLGNDKFGTGKRGHHERGLFTGGISRISKFSRISRKWSDSPSFPQCGGSLESLNSLESLENGLFWKDPFSKRPLFPNPKNQPKVCQTKVYSWTSAWMSVPKCLFFQDLELLGCPQGCPAQNFLFGLIFRSWPFSGFRNAILKGISELQKLRWLKHDF